MWNRKKEDENPRPSQQPAPTPATAAPTSKETSSTMSSMPMRPTTYDPPSPAGSATIGKAVMIKGQIFSREDLVIDGEIEGTVEAHDHRVTVGPHGKVQAGVKAREIVVLGTINGNVEAAEKIDIRKDAKLIGDIKTSRIVIEDGAYFKGSIDITKEGVKPPQKPLPPQQQPQAATPTVAPVEARK